MHPHLAHHWPAGPATYLKAAALGGVAWAAAAVMPVTLAELPSPTELVMYGGAIGLALGTCYGGWIVATAKGRAEAWKITEEAQKGTNLKRVVDLEEETNILTRRAEAAESRQAAAEARQASTEAQLARIRHQYDEVRAEYERTLVRRLTELGVFPKTPDPDRPSPPPTESAGP